MPEVPRAARMAPCWPPGLSWSKPMAGLLHDSLMQCLQLLQRYHGECKGITICWQYLCWYQAPEVCNECTSTATRPQLQHFSVASCLVMAVGKQWL